MVETVDFQQACYDLTPTASNVIAAAAAEMSAVAGAGLSILAHAPAAAPVVAVASATASFDYFHDQMENGGWHATCDALDSAANSLSGFFGGASQYDAPASSPQYDPPPFSFDFATTSGDAFSSVAQGGGPSWGAGDIGGGGGGGGDSGGSDNS